MHDYAAVWTGSTHTAVIMFDGISNPRSLEEWAGSQVWDQTAAASIDDGSVATAMELPGSTPALMTPPHTAPC